MQLRDWDKGTKSQRVAILKRFIERYQNTTVAEMERDLGTNAFLFFTRLTAWLRMTYMLGTHLTLQLKALALFLQSQRYLMQFMEVGGAHTLLDILRQKQSSLEDKKTAFSLLNLIANSGRLFRELICENNGLDLLVAGIQVIYDNETLLMGRNLLMNLGKGNPNNLSSIFKGLIQIMANKKNSMAALYAAAALRALYCDTEGLLPSSPQDYNGDGQDAIVGSPYSINAKRLSPDGKTAAPAPSGVTKAQLISNEYSLGTLFSVLDTDELRLRYEACEMIVLIATEAERTNMIFADTTTTNNATNANNGDTNPNTDDNNNSNNNSNTTNNKRPVINFITDKIMWGLQQSSLEGTGLHIAAGSARLISRLVDGECNVATGNMVDGQVHLMLMNVLAEPKTDDMDSKRESALALHKLLNKYPRIENDVRSVLGNDLTDKLMKTSRHSVDLLQDLNYALVEHQKKFLFEDSDSMGSGSGSGSGRAPSTPSLGARTPPSGIRPPFERSNSSLMMLRKATHSELSHFSSESSTAAVGVGSGHGRSRSDSSRSDSPLWRHHLHSEDEDDEEEEEDEYSTFIEGIKIKRQLSLENKRKDDYWPSEDDETAAVIAKYEGTVEISSSADDEPNTATTKVDDSSSINNSCDD